MCSNIVKLSGKSYFSQNARHCSTCLYTGPIGVKCVDLTALAARLLICAHSISASAQFGHGRGPRTPGGRGGGRLVPSPCPQVDQLLQGNFTRVRSYKKCVAMFVVLALWAKKSCICLLAQWLPCESANRSIHSGNQHSAC